MAVCACAERTQTTSCTQTSINATPRPTLALWPGDPPSFCFIFVLSKLYIILSYKRKTSLAMSTTCQRPEDSSQGDQTCLRIWYTKFTALASPKQTSPCVLKSFSFEAILWVRSCIKTRPEIRQGILLPCNARFTRSSLSNSPGAGV